MSESLRNSTHRRRHSYGNCTENLEKFNKTCLKKAYDFWEISEETNLKNDMSDKQFCCSLWDYMYCMIEKARDVCNENDFENVMTDSIKNQKELELEDCSYYTRDAIFECHFYWYYYMICLIGLIYLIALIITLYNYFKRNRKQNN